jgi:hypothetical protein
VPKIVRRLYQFTKIRDFTPEPTRLNFLPHFEYYRYVYCNINAEQDRLQSALAIAMRYVYNVPFAENMSPFYVKAQVLKVKQRSELKIM